MKIILAHPTGNANFRAAALGMSRNGLLKVLYTTVAVFPAGFLGWLSRKKPFSDFKRRTYPAELQPSVMLFPWYELGRMLAQKMSFPFLVKQETGLFSVDAVYHTLDKKVAAVLEHAGSEKLGVYAYEDGAAKTFSHAKRRGMMCFYDLPIGYWRSSRALLKLESERWPDWAVTMTGLSDSDEKLKRKEEELRLADHIFVASTFTAKTLSLYPGKLAPVHVIPYGFPDVIKERHYRHLDKDSVLKLLFVGELSQRKGLADLFTVVGRLGSKVTLTVVGRKTTARCEALEKQLALHRWVPGIPHEEVLRLMAEHDVLVFPSLFEGFGLVITEAMSQGTPVITTERTAGPDLITHGHDGWIIEAGSIAALQNSIEELLLHPDLVGKAGRQALATAGRRSWDAYGKELSDSIKLCWNERPG